LVLLNNKNMEETYIHNFKVSYDKDASNGIYYLKHDLDRKECLVFFEQAKRKKTADFEDQQERQYTLSYNNYNSYTLMRRR